MYNCANKICLKAFGEDMLLNWYVFSNIFLRILIWNLKSFKTPDVSEAGFASVIRLSYAT
jgi:hypothetical protein